MSDNIVGKLNTSYLYRIDPHTVEGWFNGKRLVFHIKSVLIDGEYYDTLYTRKNGNDDEFHAFLVPRGGFIKGDIIPWNGVQITGRTNRRSGLYKKK